VDVFATAAISDVSPQEMAAMFDADQGGSRIGWKR
jgi:hypothetical protein